MSAAQRRRRRAQLRMAASADAHRGMSRFGDLVCLQPWSGLRRFSAEFELRMVELPRETFRGPGAGGAPSPRGLLAFPADADGRRVGDPEV